MAASIVAPVCRPDLARSALARVVDVVWRPCQILIEWETTDFRCDVDLVMRHCTDSTLTSNQTQSPDQICQVASASDPETRAHGMSRLRPPFFAARATQITGTDSVGPRRCGRLSNIQQARGDTPPRIPSGLVRTLYFLFVLTSGSDGDFCRRPHLTPLLFLPTRLGYRCSLCAPQSLFGRDPLHAIASGQA